MRLGGGAVLRFIWRCLRKTHLQVKSFVMMPVIENRAFYNQARDHVIM